MSLRDDFNFPSAYLEMNESGFFSGFDSSDMGNIHTKNYVWLYNMEWLSYDKIKNYGYDYESRAIVPFAFTGGGDLWAWYLDYKPYMPVVFCPHDDDEGSFYAPSFEGALFRQILEFASHSNFYVDDGKSWQMDLVSAREHLLNWKNRFEKWFKKEWISEIEKIISLDLKYYQYAKSGYYVLITPEECNILTKRHLDFELLDKSLIWTDEE
ncbi:SMI1/KNR4 family protein [Pseudobacteroides cellulosolvens]|uniref:SMI1/KNR4 family protein n=1 Tax=Pseudobacteroides cellulosolvens ATCC 35603 = DSM 2933 TaxID=398512 RepID=A0A0L6JP42_9FIRM|nr:SMI1/KNR4 family protein [Pseudobacteroides cellulosolvens]KNY27554.1 hypothetical protein Bccel_2825 [Pseudobacteroides cellulosolvens ATCC 35603 = DSM 2933]